LQGVQIGAVQLVQPTQSCTSNCEYVAGRQQE